MAFVINVRDWQDDLANFGFVYTDNPENRIPAHPDHILMLGEIFQEMATGRRVDFYTYYLPTWAIDCNPQNRRRVSEVLGYMWRRCQAECLPELNYLLVSKRTGLPGKFMQGFWLESYGTLQGFKMFCTLRALEAGRMLDQRLVIIDLNNMIRQAPQPITQIETAGLP